MSARVCLSAIPYVDKALCDPGTFVFVTLHLFSAGRRHSYSVAKLLRLIYRLEELHTEVHGMISYPHLDKTLLFDVSRGWSQYLNRRVASSDSEVVEAPGGSIPLSLEPILFDM